MRGLRSDGRASGLPDVRVRRMLRVAPGSRHGPLRGDRALLHPAPGRPEMVLSPGLLVVVLSVPGISRMRPVRTRPQVLESKPSMSARALGNAGISLGLVLPGLIRDMP